MKQTTQENLIERFLSRVEKASHAATRASIERVIERTQPEGLALHEVQTLDSSKVGRYTMIPYGGNASTKLSDLEAPFSTDGSASGTGVVVALARILRSKVLV